MDVKEFLQMIGGPGGTVLIRSISSVSGTTEEFWVTPDDFTAESLAEQFAKKSQDEQRNMFFQVGSVEPGSKQPQLAHVVWADIDLYKYPSGETQAMGLMRRLPEPSVIVRSGRGLHVYWKLKEPLTASGTNSPAQVLSKMVQWYLGADPAHSPSKLLRVPGTFNFKPQEYEGGLPCEIIQVNDVTYTPDDFPVDDVLFRIGHKAVVKIMLGPEEAATDRSEYDFSVAASLYQQGLSEAEVKHLMRTYPFSGKAHSEPGNLENYISRTAKSALFRVQINPGTAKRRPSEPVAWVGKSLQEILAEEKPPFIISDFLPAQGLAMVAAPPKARKSWCVMQMAYEVATGGEWLGFGVPAPKKVAYVQAELPNWMVAERMVQMYGTDGMENLRFYHIPASNLAEDDDIEGLVNVVRESGVELVIIDPISNFWQGDENSSSSVNLLFDQLAKVQAAGAALVVVHHSRKTQQNERLSPQHQRGSNVFFARPAAIMTLSPFVVPGEVPFTYADFALRAAVPKEPLTLYTESSGKFTVNPPTLGSISPVRQMMIDRTRKHREESAGVLTYG